MCVPLSVSSRSRAGSSPASRQLQQTINTGNARCPDGCLRPFMDPTTGTLGATTDKTDYCQQDATMGGLYCTRCVGSLVVKLVRCLCCSQQLQPRQQIADGCIE